MNVINTKITKVTECEARETKNGTYYLRMKFLLLKDDLKASLTLFLDSYDPVEVTELLKVLKFTGTHEDFANEGIDNQEDRVRNFKLDFATAVECVVSEEEFTNDKNETIKWYKVRKIGNNFELKEKALSTIKNKDKFVRSFPTATNSVPF